MVFNLYYLLTDPLTLIFGACLIWLFVRSRRLARRVDQQGRDIMALQDGLAARLADGLPKPDVAPATQPASATVTAPDSPVPEPAQAPEFETAPSRPVFARIPEPAPPAAPPPNRPAVFTADLGARLAAFLQRHWVYVVSAVSLALAGVFLVQYGIDNGYLTPRLRVLAALALGAGLVLWGERLRRRHGDAPDSSVAYLPATFSGAGIVSIFVAIVAARQMYDLIGPLPTLLGLVATGALSIVLGWFNGSFLVAVGLIGAAAAPFLTGGGGAAPVWFFGYYALIAGIGLAVDTVRRWAWVSVLALVLGYLGGLASLNFGAGEIGWSALLLVLPVLATVLPERSLVPRQAGPAFASRALPPFPVRLVAGALLASSVLLVLVAGGATGTAMLALMGLAFLVLAYCLWASAAEGLADLASLPAAGFLLLLVLQALGGGGLWVEFHQQALDLRPPESPAPATVTLIMALLAAMMAAGAVRALTPGPLARAQGIGAVLIGGLGAAILQFLWQPALVTGDFPWALQIMGLAAVAAAMALTFARRDGADHHRMATAALISLSLVALSLAAMTSGTPLTLALCVLVVVAAWLDRRLDLAEMAIFLQVGAAVLTWRMLVEPGVFLSFDLPLADFLAGMLAPVLAGAAALWLIRPRLTAQAVLESATALWIVGFLDGLVIRWLDAGGDRIIPEHLAASLVALPWIGAMLAQLYRAARSPVLRRLRLVVAGVSGVMGLGLLALAATVLNPLNFGDVTGPWVADSMALAYLVPGLMLVVAGRWLPGLKSWLQRGALGAGAALGLMYLFLEIRRFWWGDWIAAHLGVQQGELYTYTLALMGIGAGLLLAALSRHSTLLRRIAMAVIALTIAKVFLIDAAGLTGLTRVISFLGLGLSLAGLAWLNGWVERATRAAKGAPSGPADPPAAA